MSTSTASVKKPEKADPEEVLNEDEVEDLEEEDDLEDINTSDRSSDEDDEKTDFSTYKERLAVKPSTNVWDHWIFCHDLSRKNSISGKDALAGDAKNKHIGKYLIYEDDKHIDESWEKIRTATENGELGFAAKVATKKEKPREIAGQLDARVICVYSKYTATDESDKVRVLQALRDLGYSRHLPYKTDSSGAYTDKGKKDGPEFDDDEISDDDSEYSAAETDTSRGDVSGKGTEQDSDLESDEYSDLPKKQKSEPTPKPKDPTKQTEYVRLYTTPNTYTLDVYLHLKQMTSTRHSGKQDVQFPMDEAAEIAESVYQLGHKVLADEKDSADGITTSHVKLSVGYSTDFKAHSVFVKSTKCDSMVSFPQADAVFYYNRIGWYYKYRS